MLTCKNTAQTSKRIVDRIIIIHGKYVEPGLRAGDFLHELEQASAGLKAGFGRVSGRIGCNKEHAIGFFSPDRTRHAECLQLAVKVLLRVQSGDLPVLGFGSGTEDSVGTYGRVGREGSCMIDVLEPDII